MKTAYARQIRTGVNFAKQLADLHSQGVLDTAGISLAIKAFMVGPLTKLEKRAFGVYFSRRSIASSRKAQ